MKRPGISYVKQSLTVQSAWLLVLALGILAGQIIPKGPYLHGPGTNGQMLTWDGLWYLDIAQHGYGWDQAIGMNPGHLQNVAFFPGYPLIEWTLIHLTGDDAPWLMILPGLAGQFLAILAFRRLARDILPDAGAALATWLFGLWPACCFMIMGYPAGLTNLCAICALSHYRANKPVAASLWCGAGTALAPTLVFVAVALVAHFTFRKARLLHRPITVALFGLGSISGLLAYMLFLALRFHDPFAFIKAQDAFNMTPPLLLHLATMLDLNWYGLVLRHFGAEIRLAFYYHEAASPAGRERIEAAFQLVVNLGAVMLTIIGLIAAALKPGCRGEAAAGACVLAGYLWFIASTDHNLIAGARLLYPAIGLFLGLGSLVAGNQTAKITVIAAFATLSILETALIAAGYAVI
jgi:hypothetical protein